MSKQVTIVVLDRCSVAYISECVEDALKETDIVWEVVYYIDLIFRRPKGQLVVIRSVTGVFGLSSSIPNIMRIIRFFTRGKTLVVGNPGARKFASAFKRSLQQSLLHA